MGDGHGDPPAALGGRADPDRRVDRCLVDESARFALRRHHRRKMAGERQVHRLERRLPDAEGDRRHRLGLEMPDVSIDLGQHLGRIVAVQRVRADRGAQSSHHHRGGQTPAHHVADGHAQPARRHGEDVVPVAADLQALAGDVARPEVEAGDPGQLARQERALQRRRGVAFGGGQLAVQVDRDAVGGDPQPLDVVLVELPVTQRAHVEDAEQPALAEQRHTDERLDALPPQQWIDHGVLADLVDEVRLQVSGDAPREALPDADADTLAYLFFDPGGRGGDELLSGGVEKKNRRCVGIEVLPNPVQKHLEHVFHLQVCQVRVRDRLDPTQAVLSFVLVDRPWHRGEHSPRVRRRQPPQT